uniref:Transmembrane protein 107 n=1 Tax=Nothobranchius furzeri TaxID=105023 RepID=A0A8C6PS01_NOTFU
MSAISSLVPARFLTITAHLVIVITIFWSRVRKKWFIFNLISYDTQYSSSLLIRYFLPLLEVCFPNRQLSPALAVHCSASVSLSFFVFEKWECWTYWVIFATCRSVCLCVVANKCVISQIVYI